MVSRSRTFVIALASLTAIARSAAAADDGAAPDAADTAVASSAPAGAVSADAGAARPPDLSYGAAARLRWVSVPSAVLGLFTKKNVPLSSWGAGVELFRRKGSFDFGLSFNYQNMSPSDGNWLANGHVAGTDTTFVQFRGLALYGIDVSFVWHTMFTSWLGIHYGAGAGIGIVGGSVLRTSDSTDCTDANAGDLAQCHPAGATCTSASCQLTPDTLQPGPDSPTTPHRTTLTQIPSVIPVVSAVLGVDFRIPRTNGLEATLEGGVYDAFFLGGGVGYSF